MMNEPNKFRTLPKLILPFLILAGAITALAQNVAIPDPGLNAVIRETLQKPIGPLTEQDLLTLTNLQACCRNIQNLQGIEAARNLAVLNLEDNALGSFQFPTNLTRLATLILSDNPLTNLFFPDGLTNLTTLVIESCGLTNFTVPTDLTRLLVLELGGNQLTQVALPSDLRRLSQLGMSFNQFSNLVIPAGLTNLSFLALQHNQLTTLTLAPDTTRLDTILLGDNPFQTLVLSEPSATGLLSNTVTSLKNDGISVFTYPVEPRLVRPLELIGAFKFALTGPPGTYSILRSSNLIAWEAVRAVNNPLGSINFQEPTAGLAPQEFYRAVQPGPPTNMVFIPPTTFTMGSPTNELHRNVNEGPQTTVTLTHGYWIGKHEVTQAEYLEVTGENPSVFPGDPSRAVSSVSWPDATNYCALLTARELAAGRILPGSQYRLPTEAEWECAARAGTSTRFSYGDDPDYASLTNHAWYYLNSDFTVHPVGRKLPNPWGLYDMGGNVWEWCQDWLGDLPGGAVTDPRGPASNPIGWKVIRGGGYDFGESDCRSARRYFFGNHPALNDSNLGFRVVLVTETP